MSAIIKIIVAALAEAFLNFLWSKKNEIIEFEDDTKTDWDGLEDTVIDSGVSDNDSRE
jgi:nitrogen fixation-related uncharacterized protein